MSASPVRSLFCSLLTAFVLVLGSSASRGAAIITASETSGNVVLTGTGTLNLSALSLFFNNATSSAPGGMLGVPPVAVVGSTGVPCDLYKGLVPPASIGPGTSFKPADSGSGDFFG